MTDDQQSFEDFVLNGGPINDGPFEPNAFYDADGDQLEFVGVDSNYYARQIGNLGVVYLDRETNAVVGGVIYNPLKFFERMAGKKDAPRRFRYRAYPGGEIRYGLEYPDGRIVTEGEARRPSGADLARVVGWVD